MITNRDVNNLLSFIPNVIGKAYVTHIFSSGMKKDQALSITISDLIEACDSAFGFTEKRTLENLLVKNPENIVPMWRIKKKNKVKITFSSSESLFYIFIYLTERLVKNKSISLDEKLFVTGKKVLSSKELNDIFKYSEKRYMNYIGFSLKYHNLDTFDYHQYHYSSTGLLNNFKYVSEKVLSNSIDDKKERNKLKKLFTDGLSENDKYFELFSNNTSKLKEIYLTIVPYLTAKNYDCDYPDYFPEMKTFIDFMQSNEKVYPEEIVTQILKDYMRFALDVKNLDDYSDGEELFEIFKDLVLFDNKHGFFKESKEYLTFLWQNTLITYDIRGCDFEFNDDTSIEDVVNYVEELGIFDKFKVIKKEYFLLSIEDYFSALDMNKIKRNLSKDDLAGLLCESREDGLRKFR